MEAISGKARRHLRALGHHLQPVVLVGKEGLSVKLFDAVKTALADHELIKVKLGENVEGDRNVLATALAESTKSDLVGLTGRTLLLYRRHPKKPKIVLPDAKTNAASKTAATTKKTGTAPTKGKKAALSEDSSTSDASDDHLDDGDDGDFDDE